MQAVREDVTVLKTKMDRLITDVHEIKKILIDAEKSVVNRTYILEEKMKNIEKDSWHAKVLQASAVVTLLGSLIFYFITGSKP